MTFILDKRMDAETRQNAAPLSWTTEEVLEATGGRLISGPSGRVFSGVSIDSRTIASGNLFVAIAGTTFDGHDFIGEVINRGICGLVTAEGKTDIVTAPDWDPGRMVCIAVKDTTRALGDLAAFNRRRANISLIAITGSNGKTTTREMTAAVVSQSYRVLVTGGNLNNEIGLPLTLLNLTADHQWAVVEIAMNRPGEIFRLTKICDPDIGVITNIGPAHLEGLGSIDGVMRAKGELLQAMEVDRTAVLNADDPRVLHLAASGTGHMIYFGRSERASVRASSLVKTGLGTRFSLSIAPQRSDIQLKLPGEFMVQNALAAAACGHALGLTIDQIKSGLESVAPVAGRMNTFSTPGGIHVIDDTYNANPGSMEAALNTLAALAGGQRSALVAGDMLELGAYAQALHQKIGALAARLKISKIFLAGENASSVRAGARSQGMDAADIFIGSREDISAYLRVWLAPGDWVLVKGSRAMGMEKVVRAISAGPDETSRPA